MHAAQRRLQTVGGQLKPTHQGRGDEDAGVGSRHGSFWSRIQLAPPDPILGLTEAFKKDTDGSKLNLGVGAYRTEEGKPLVLDVVKEAERRLLAGTSAVKEYLAIEGLPEFCALTRELAFGRGSEAIASHRIATVQSLSGTGALRVGGEFLAAQHGSNIIYLPSPTWGNHNKIFPCAGLQIRSYRYFDARTRGLDYQGLLEDLRAAPAGAVVLLHACAHNPTGVDPNMDQWRGILDTVRRSHLLPFFDSAYQGFASGDLERDAFAIRLFADSGLQMMLAQSYAKNMGLYGERVGALSVVCADAEEAVRVESQLKSVIRPMYSSPPRHGAEIVALVLSDRALFVQWQRELKAMAGRIMDMRAALHDALVRENVPGSWRHILDQIGMFSFTGLTKPQVGNMVGKWHVYMTADGRISMAGLSRSRCAYLAQAINDSVLHC